MPIEGSSEKVNKCKKSEENKNERKSSVAKLLVIIKTVKSFSYWKNDTFYEFVSIDAMKLVLLIYHFSGALYDIGGF